MGDELDINIIKATQNSLGKYVKRPPLSEKLLRKPPFRFIHDIITAVVKSTGFFNDLFTEEELVSDNVRDRDRKISFLNKVIFVAGYVTGRKLTVKSSKIIAGQEPEKTNELFQCIALALDSKLSSDAAVKQYKEQQTKTENTESKHKNDKRLQKKGTDSKAISKNGAKTETNIKTKNKESPPKKTSQSLRSSSKVALEKPKNGDKNSRKTVVANLSQSVINSNIQKPDTDDSELNQKHVSLIDGNSEAETRENIQDTMDSSSKPNIMSSDKTLASVEYLTESQLEADTHKETNEDDNEGIDNKDFIEDDKNIENPTSNSKIEQTVELSISTGNDIRTIPEKEIIIESTKDISTNENITNSKPSRPLSVRPSSSRPGAPRLRDKYDDMLIDSDNVLIGKVNIISENTVEEEDEESSIIIIENTTDSTMQSKAELTQLISNEHGHLVQQILDSQKEFAQDGGKTEIDWHFGAKKARDVINQEIDQLRFNLQALSRVANPLGKLLDHIQEDVEVMRQELHYWTKTYNSAHEELIKQKKANEEKLQPLHSKLKQINVEIVEKQEKISDLKMTIHKNALRIDKLLANGNKQ